MSPLPIVSLNGQFIPAESAKISPFGEGFMFGRGLFETIRILDGKPVFLRSHLERISQSAKFLGLAWAAPLDELADRIMQVVTQNQMIGGNLKLIIFADVAGVSELILARSFVYPEEKYLSGFHLKVVAESAGRLRSSEQGGVKSTSYLAHLLAREAAKNAGADDGLFVDTAGRALETSTANIFMVRNGQIVTSPIPAGVLPGIARGQILLRSTTKVQERDLTLEELKLADEVFVTNALMGVMPVAAIDGKRYSITDYILTPAMRADFVRWQRESVA